MILLSIALLQAAVSTGGPRGPVLWRDTREGMTPEQFADELRKQDGIKDVEVTRKGSKPAKIKINYVNGSGLPIGTLTMAISPTFDRDALKSVVLSQTTCYSVAEVNLATALSALADKYAHTQRIRIVDDAGVQLGSQQAFYNDETRVTVAVTPIENPYPTHSYGGSGFVAAMNKLGNSMADSAYNNAIAACPADHGRKAVLELAYMSQSEFAVAHDKEQANRDAKNRAVKDGL